MTVGELREALNFCDDDEPIHFFFDYYNWCGIKKTKELVYSHLSSSGGGRITLLTFSEKHD